MVYDPFNVLLEFYLATLGLSCGRRNLHCSMRDLSLWCAGSSLWCAGFSLVVVHGLQSVLAQ